MAGEIIRITGGPAQGSQLDIAQELQIGRSAGAEGRLGDDPEISRQHARISRNPQGQLVVEDLGSTNGTYVNGQRIAGPTVLNPGDSLQMGRSSLTVEGGAVPGGGQATAIGAVPVGIPPAARPPPPAAGPPPPPPGPPGGGFTPTGPTPGQYGAPSGGNNNSKIALIAGGVVAVIIIAVVLVLALGGGDDDKTDSTQASNTTTASTPTTPPTATTPTTDTSDFSMDTSELSTEISTDTGGDVTEPGNYPPNIKEQFIKGCTGGGGTEEQCSCTIDAIEDKYSLTEFLDLVSKASGGLPDELQAIVRKCA